MSVIKGWKFPVQVDKENGRIKRQAPGPHMRPRGLLLFVYYCGAAFSASGSSGTFSH